MTRRDGSPLLLWIIAAIAIMCGFAIRASAQHVCYSASRGWYEYQTASCTTAELMQPAFDCDFVRQLPSCIAPATFAMRWAPAPFNTPVRFGGEYVDHGVRMWRWLRVGASGCAGEVRPAYAQACAAKDGEVLYVTPRFWGAEVSR